jgi:hypothetical protein
MRNYVGGNSVTGFASLEEWRWRLNGTYKPYFDAIVHLRTYNGTLCPYLYVAA